MSGYIPPVSPRSGFPVGAQATALVGIVPKLPSQMKNDAHLSVGCEDTQRDNEHKQEPSYPLKFDDTVKVLPHNPAYPDDQGPGYVNEDDIPDEIKALPKGIPSPTEKDDDVEPVGPILSTVDVINGYENSTLEPITNPPPSSYMLLSNQTEPQREPITDAAEISSDDAKDALIQFVSQNCCYGKRPAKDLNISNMSHSSAFQYILESFTECRQTRWTYEAYTGGAIDSCKNGMAPSPWDIPVQTPTPFEDSVVSVEIPHTASAKVCVVCSGYGRKKCHRCYGHGFEQCKHCMGEGREDATASDTRERCFYCHGYGKKQCWKCNGQGIISCTTCKSSGQIKCFIKLTVTWTNNIDDRMIESGLLPIDLVKTVTGRKIFEDEQTKLWPLNHFPNNEVNDISAQFVKEHSMKFESERILKQRQRLRVIPVAEVSYSWKNRNGQFYIYGDEHKVHAPDYPQKCCCSCCIQ